jgi:hypothetical protein
LSIQYVGQIIFEEAKRVTKEMTKEPPMSNEKALIHQRYNRTRDLGSLTERK